MNKWNKNSIDKINNIKFSILKRKIMLSFIIDNYSKWDKVYRWTHNFLAITTPILITIQTTLYNNENSNENNKSSGTVAIIFSFIVAGMIKLKEYITYDKIRDLAKEQTVKYQQLFERIENELIKNDDKRQLEGDFIYWLGRELQHIEINDPELSNSEKKRFILLCKEKNIPYDEDLEMINKLIQNQKKDVKIDNNKELKINIKNYNANGNKNGNMDGNIDGGTDGNKNYNVDCNIDGGNKNYNVDGNIDGGNKNYNVDSNVVGNMNNNVVGNMNGSMDSNVVGNMNGSMDSNVVGNMDSNVEDSDDMKHSDDIQSLDDEKIPTIHKILSIHLDYETLNKINNINNTNKEEKEKYKECIKNINTKSDMKWTLERLNNLKDNIN